MSSNQKLSLKVYLIDNNITKEIRKFPVDADTVGNFGYIIGMIRQVFSDLSQKDLQVFWKDSEGDYLTISSDDELDEAIQGIPVGSNNLKLYVKEKQNFTKPTHKIEHPGVVCDGCNSKITGIRYKCTQCHDFDLCSECEMKVIHPKDHEFFVIKTPRQSSARFVINRSPQFLWRPYGGKAFYYGRPLCCQFTESQPPQCKRKFDQEKSTNVKNDKPLKEYNERIASVFSLDPHVIFNFDVSKQEAKQNEGKTERKGEEKKEAEMELKDEDNINQKEVEEFFTQIGSALGVDPIFVASVTTHLFPELKAESKKETKENDINQNESLKHESSPKHFNKESKCEEPKRDQEEETKTKEDLKTEEESNIEEKSREASTTKDSSKSQFEFSSENQQNGQSLSNFKQSMVQDFQNEQNKKEEKNKTQKDEFVFVEKKKEDLSKNEEYQQRLNKALRQMEAMGFDNDGGWLSQLLISKDLNIGRVLDALNPLY